MSTSVNLPAGDHIERFGSLINDAFCPMALEISRRQRDGFHGELLRQQLGHVTLATVRSSALDVYRRRQHIGQTADSFYLVKVQVEGEGRVSHRGREAHLLPGDFTLCLSSEPYQLHFETEYSQVVLAVPEQLMEECVQQPAQHLGLRMDSRVGANGLFSQFVTSVAQRLDTLDGVLAQRLEANVIDLLSTTLGYAREAQRRDLFHQGVKREYLQRIKHFIRRHLDEERLGPEWIADAHHISTRYLHMLFESESESVSRYIQRLRLENCREALADPSFANYPVSEIAYRSGFKDASHFSRSFKKEFGATPARFRKNYRKG